MNHNNLDEIIQEYIKKIKEKLPEWMKEDKEELNDVLSEIEEHIWDKADELSDNGTATEESLKQALSYMGRPVDIAREYKKRGVPKVYITEDLWPLYKKVLGILSSVVILIYFVFMIINLVFGKFQFEIFGILFGLTGVFTLVTIIFVALSMEGYLPENFRTQEEKEIEKRTRKLAEKGKLPVSPRTGKPLKPFIDPTANIVGGIIQMAIGLLFVIQPETPITYLINSELLAIFRIFGVFIVIEGGLHLVRGIIGNQQITNHQIIIGIKIVLSILGIPLLAILMEKPEIVPFIPFDDVFISGFFGFVIVATVIGIISDIYKAVTLEKFRDKSTTEKEND